MPTIMASILLVDDDDSVLLTSSIALRRQGHEVVVAGDAQQALRQLEKRRFEFLISDIQMPGIDGLELAARVRAISAAPRIILMSAHYDQRRLPDSLSSAFLQKPLDFDALGVLLGTSPAPPAAKRHRAFHFKRGWGRHGRKRVKTTRL